MASTELTTRRVKRLLRPLRVACSHFAAHGNSSAAISSGITTYGRTSAWRPAQKGPLATILPPEAFQPSHRASTGDVRDAELSRKLYAVRNCFRNVVHGVLGSPTSTSGISARIPSLGAMCASVVGVNILEEVNFQESDDEPEENMEMEMEIIDTMYEYIPAGYRRHAILTHAISQILHVCPPDPTLLSVLLDVTLPYTLELESRQLLTALLSAAIPPSSSVRTAPLLHPAHSTYLSGLLTRWTSANLPPSSFTQILCVALSHRKASSPELWTGKAVRRVARDLRSADLSSFVQLASSLGRALPTFGANTACAPAYTRLTKWMCNMFDVLYADGEPEQMGCMEVHDQVTQFLVSTPAHSAKGSEDAEDAADTATSLATFCLASSLCKPESARELAELLRSTTPRKSTYDSLVLLLFPLRTRSSSLTSSSTPSTDPRLGSALHIMSSLDLHARALRTHKLARHEAALWACALRTLEAGWMKPDGRGAAVNSMRELLVRRMEGAERRCFGGNLSSSATLEGDEEEAEDDDQQTRPPNGKDEQWRWESLVGAWVQKTPARPLPTFQTPSRPSFSAHIMSVGRTPGLSHKKSAAKLAPSPDSSDEDLAEGNLIDGLSDEEEIGTKNADEWGAAGTETPIPARAVARAMKAKVSKPIAAPIFKIPVKPLHTTILRDARLNSAETNEHQRERRVRESRAPHSPPHKRARFAAVQPTSIREARQTRGNKQMRLSPNPVSQHIPSSDDALDLFGQPNQSPVFMRRSR